MPLENQFNTSPYYDDYDPQKDFYRVLFRPSVAVQTRELNQLQTIIQTQIERFGNHLFKDGTIVSGVNFSYLPTYSFVKILDLQEDGQPVVPSGYKDLFVRDSLNLTARVVNYADGFESKAPNLSTLYLQYTNSSEPDTSNSNVRYSQFRSGTTLTVFSKDYELFKTRVNNGGTGFSNSDSVVIQSALVVASNTGAFANGEYVRQATTNAVAQIVQVNTTAIADSIVLKVRPRTVDLTNNSVNAAAWSFTTGYNIVANNGSTANVVSLVGRDATAVITTDSLGIILSTTVTSGGSGYEVPPYVTVKTSNTTATVSSLDIAALNYKAQLTAGNSTVNAIGTGYAFGVSAGIIYQKGYFLRVEPQVIVVDQYSTTPNNVVVGFSTKETTVDSNADSSLFDNASDTTNYSAPGAHRLKLVPTLIVANTEVVQGNTEFFALAEWKNGQPYRENRTTAYSHIGEEMARRTYDASGDFALDPFLITTKDKPEFGSANLFVVIDPGKAYVRGNRVETGFNNYLEIPRANTTLSAVNQTVSANYGNYVVVDELGGTFNFKQGDVVYFRSVARNYISTSQYNGSTQINPAGVDMGKARIRSLVLESGEYGSASARYRMYLFDITMYSGQSFRNVRSVHYNGTNDGIADIVLERDPTTNQDIAMVYDIGRNNLIFPVPGPTKSVDNITYHYRTSDSSLTVNTSGYAVITLVTPGQSFPYGVSTLSTTQERDFTIVPLADTDTTANVGVISVSSATNVITGSGTSFTTTMKVGDYVRLISNASVQSVRRIDSITNNTVASLSSVPTFTNTVAIGILTYPANIPVTLRNRGAINQTNATSVTINLSQTLSGVMGVDIGYNVKYSPTTSTAKSVVRDAFVKINTSTHTANTTGPWSLGVPDVIRLKAVYLGNTSSNSTNLTPAQVGIQNITKYFTVDIGQSDDAYRVAKLVQTNQSGYTIPAGRMLLVQFDATQSSGRTLYTINSYNIDDTLPLASSTTTINRLEVPEYFDSGLYRDVASAIDFRPVAANTGLLTTSANSATVNPSTTFSLAVVDQLFPVPDSTITYDVEYYVGRFDSVVVNQDGTFEVVQGLPSTRPVAPKVASGAIRIGTIAVAPYPSLPTAQSSDVVSIATKYTSSGGQMTDIRANRSVVRLVPSDRSDPLAQVRAYTMRDIQKLEARINTLEYYTAFNMVEGQVRSMNIPSSVTPTINRFKYGFFVDSFNDYSYSDTTSAEFSATVNQEDGLLQPLTKSFNGTPIFNRADASTSAAIVNGSTLMLPFTEEVLVNQTIATSVIGSDGQKVQFGGSLSISPASFNIRVRGESTAVPDPVVTTSSGSGSYYQASGVADSGFTKSEETYTFGGVDGYTDGSRFVYQYGSDSYNPTYGTTNANGTWNGNYW
jgi:Domain of unknown function (DUF4815)